MRTTQPWRTNRARVLRSSSSSADDLMWSELRNRQLGGLKFIRQCPIGPYFVDFACRERMVIVEIDGGTHSTAEEIAADNSRSANLEAQGFRIFRTHNTEVYENLDGVLDTLIAFIEGSVA